MAFRLLNETLNIFTGVSYKVWAQSKDTICLVLTSEWDGILQTTCFQQLGCFY